MELIIENKKLFITLFVIVVVIMLIVLWSPEKDIELSHYEGLSEEQVDNIAIKQYGDEIKLAMYSQDEEFLNDRVSEEYLKYIEVDKSNYTKWLENNNLFTRIYKSLIYRGLYKSSIYCKYIYNKVLNKNYDVEVGFLAGVPCEIIKRSPNLNSKKYMWIHCDVNKEDIDTYNKYKFLITHNIHQQGSRSILSFSVRLLHSITQTPLTPT